jgi:hypothetical protein
MSDSTSDKKPKPIYVPDEAAESADTSAVGAPADPTPADVAAEEPVAETKPSRRPKKSDAAADSADSATAADASEPATVSGTATGDVTPEPTSDFAGREVVYVQAPVPPKLKGNRGVGTLLAVVGVLLFAAVYAAIAFVLIATVLNNTGATFSQFLTTSVFLVPVSLFLVAFILLVLIVNRAGWAAHVFGSLVVGLVVYFGTAGIALLLYTVGGTGDAPSFLALLGNPFIVIAALVAREISIWVGLAIAARGRRVKERNLDIVEAWEKEHAETKAQYERAGTPVA